MECLINGDLNIQIGSDPSLYGYGDLNINRNCNIFGTTNASSTYASLMVMGGAVINKSCHVNENFNTLYGVTNITETHIDTTNGETTITGGNAVNIQVGASSQFIVTQGSLTLQSQSDSTKLYGGSNSLGIDIKATNINGNVSIMSGTDTGSIQIGAGYNIYGTASNGSILLNANHASQFVVNSLSNNQDLNINLNGSTDSQLNISSSGTNATKTALLINTTNTNGSIQISNSNGLGNGNINIKSGSGGFNLITNTSGPLSLLAQGASGSFFVDTINDNQNLTIGVNNTTASCLLLRSDGITNAIQIKTLNTAGNINITQPQYSQGRIYMFGGSIFAETQTGGSINYTCNGATSLYSNATESDNQDLNISVTGNTNSKVNISSSGTNYDAIKLETNNSGGIYLTSQAEARIESNSSIEIGTNSTEKINVGTGTSTTTIFGNLDVKGTVTTIESQIVTIDDNIVLINNGPSGLRDSGIAVKRFQSANDISYGDVASYEQDQTGNVQTGNNTVTTVHLGFGANGSILDYYKGWWVKIISGTGSGQVRKIKSYDNSTKIATIYSSADQISLGNPSPIIGLDFNTIPDITSTYGLYPCNYLMEIWDESNNEFALCCSATDPADQVNIVHYHDLHLRNLTATNIYTTYINDIPSDTYTTVILANTNTTPVTITGFPSDYGVFMIYVFPLTDTLRANAIFMCSKNGLITNNGVTHRYLSSPGVSSDQLKLQWPGSSKPQLFFTPFPTAVSGSTIFKVRIISLF